MLAEGRRVRTALKYKKLLAFVKDHNDLPMCRLKRSMDMRWRNGWPREKVHRLRG